MIMQLLAEAVHSNGDGVWLSVAAITALGAATIGIVKAFKAGEEKGKVSQEFTLKKPVPTVRTQEEPRYVQREEFREHCEAASAEMQRIWEHFGVERKLSNEELSKIHERLNYQTQATSQLKGAMDQIQANVKSLLDLALGKTPRPR